jgi:hypothetical protein
VANAREDERLTETMKLKCKQKLKELEGMRNGEPSIVRIRCLKKAFKNLQKLGHE